MAICIWCEEEEGLNGYCIACDEGETTMQNHNKEQKSEDIANDMNQRECA
jgi:hypothetical protein